MVPVAVPPGLRPAAWLGFARFVAGPTVVLLFLVLGLVNAWLQVGGDYGGSGLDGTKLGATSCSEIVWGCVSAGAGGLECQWDPNRY